MAQSQGQRQAVWARIRSLIQAIQDNDEARIAEAVLSLSRRHRLLTPLAFLVGAFALLFDGLKLIVSNWRLLIVQILPAMWIWLAMYDLKLHVLHGHSFNALRGPILVAVGAAVVGITMACYYLNAVFAFAIAGEDKPPRVRPAVTEARRHLTPILVSGAVVGVLLALLTLVATRQPHPWFTLSLSIVVGLMMLTYVALPARLIGVRQARSPREKLTVSAVGGAIGATVCTPPYVLGRVGLLMLGSKVLFIPGIFVFAVGVTLQAGATGAVRAIKMSTKLGIAGSSADVPAAPGT